MPSTDAMMRELNHRTNNNFQIIASLLSLKKRMVPPDRRHDLRFIEEHVLCLSVAHRLVYASSDMNEVAVSHLIRDVVAGLRQVATLPEDKMQLEVSDAELRIGLDQAIALALYLASLLPPYLDHARAGNAMVRIIAGIAGDAVTLVVDGQRDETLVADPLRCHLMNAFSARLGAAQVPPSPGELGVQIRFRLEPAEAEVSGPALDRGFSA